MFNYIFGGGSGNTSPNNPSDTLSHIADATTPRNLGRGASETVTTSTSHDTHGNPTTTIGKTTTIQSAVGGPPMEIKNPEKVMVTTHRDGTQQVAIKTTTAAPLPGMPTEYTSPVSLNVTSSQLERTYTTQYRSTTTLGGDRVDIKQGPTLVQNTLTGQYAQESSNPISPDQLRTPVTLVGQQQTTVEQITQILSKHTSSTAKK